VDYVAAALLPWAEEQRGVLPGQVAIAGQSLGGLTALRLGLRRPDLVSHVISQSASLWQDDLAEEVAAAAGCSLRPRVHLAHGEQEWALAGPHRDLAERLRAGGVPVAETTYNGGHDYAWWRGAIADALVWLWGPAPS
jgi:enterochelin esterase family protein